MWLNKITIRQSKLILWGFAIERASLCCTILMISSVAITTRKRSIRKWVKCDKCLSSLIPFSSPIFSPSLCCWLYRLVPLDTLAPDLKVLWLLLHPLAQHKEVSPAKPYRQKSTQKILSMCRAANVLKVSELLLSVMYLLFFMFVKRVVMRRRQVSICQIVKPV